MAFLQSCLKIFTPTKKLCTKSAQKLTPAQLSHSISFHFISLLVGPMGLTPIWSLRQKTSASDSRSQWWRRRDLSLFQGRSTRLVLKMDPWCWSLKGWCNSCAGQGYDWFMKEWLILLMTNCWIYTYTSNHPNTFPPSSFSDLSLIYFCKHKADSSHHSVSSKTTVSWSTGQVPFTSWVWISKRFCW